MQNITIETKTCRLCGQIKPIEEFRVRKESGKRRSECKSCLEKNLHNWLAKNPNYRKENYKKNQKHIRKLVKLRKNKDFRLYMYRKIKQRAKERGWEFNIEYEDFPQIPEYCPVLGIKLDINAPSSAGNLPSLDRLDSSKDYIFSNVRIISKRANFLKSNAKTAEIEAIIKYMEENGCE